MIKVRVAHKGVSLSKEHNILQMKCNVTSEGDMVLSSPRIEKQVKSFSQELQAFYEIRPFIIVSTKACHFTLPDPHVSGPYSPAFFL
jgi:hypothetical protein